MDRYLKVAALICSISLFMRLNMHYLTTVILTHLRTMFTHIGKGKSIDWFLHEFKIGQK